MNKTTREPRFMDMPAEDLRRAYWDARNGAATWDRFASAGHGRSVRTKVAGGVQDNLRRMDLIVACARKRGIALT